MAPVTRKRKANDEQRFYCYSCATERVFSQFPDYNPTPDCDHLINTCKSCLKKWVESNVTEATFASAKDGEGKGLLGIKCPQCDGIMRNVNIENAATKKIYDRFDELERKHIGDTTPGWRWCLAPDCRAGQVHETAVIEEPAPKRRKLRGLLKKAKPKPEPEPDICTCHKCGAKACAPCDRPFHEGETCAAYQARIKDRVQEEDKALKTIHSTTKSCPNCKKRIEKNGGCPAMHCSSCGVGFCWQCLMPFDNRGCGCTRQRP